MGVACTVCALPTAGAIAELLRSGRSARAVAAEFGLSYDAVTRHARNHVAKRPSTPVPDSGADPLDELVKALRVRALAGSPADTREYRLALAAQSDLRHSAPPQHDLATEPEWIELRARMLHALEPFPEARAAIVAAIGGL